VSARPFSRLLVANRGEIARRIVRSAAALGLDTVAVYSDPDAGSPLLDEADEAVRLPGASPADTYLRADLLLDAARRTGADAVHPGYGFLAEDAGFAQAVLDAGLVWVGPPPAAVAAMGSKLHAKALAREAGVPVLETVEVPGDAPDSVDLPFPLLVKASYGGGGRGMRVVSEQSQLAAAVAAARREAEAAFGNGTVFLEPWVLEPRHVELQVFADSAGTVVSLGERECSLQRRHQKVVEESPSPGVERLGGQQLRDRMAAAAVSLARAVGYVGAGTVEFLLAPDGSFAFLEMNTRLQVEHPVTELVSGLDLVALQLRVAAGEPLPGGLGDLRPRGWAVEARLYAEDPARGWLPRSGTLHRVRFPDGVRVDSGVRDGSVVGVSYDPMLAKVVAHADTRTEAARRLATALARTSLHGPTTNRDLLVRVLRSEPFLAGDTDTGFLERHGGTDPERLAAPLLDAAGRRLSAVAAVVAATAERRASARVLGGLPPGWRNNPSSSARAEFEDGTVVDYRHTRGGLQVAVDGEPLAVECERASSEEVVLVADGVRRRFAVSLVPSAPGSLAGATAYVDSALGSAAFVERPRFPDPAASVAAGSLRAAMPGAVLRVAVEPGQAVTAGDVVLVLEAMKMEHPVTAPADGVVAELAVGVGSQVDAGQVLAVVEPAAGRTEEAS
jgi:propionyl-CoA carboxylase alpha chain